MTSRRSSSLDGIWWVVQVSKAALEPAMSFKELKTKRDARLNQTNTVDPVSVHEKEYQTVKDGLYSQLNGSGLDIKNTSTRGRGLWANKSIKPGKK
jgi:hypothetical protein